MSPTPVEGGDSGRTDGPDRQPVQTQQRSAEEMPPGTSSGGATKNEVKVDLPVGDQYP
ncbi:hypothetical protein PC129_g19229 [Phytophthora cactorum]|uniref:Uncharacterized protein n=1 Tax=Phytophthora cactorum TaxID=29920 RepID=A0A8T1JW86_9STRA|nr:hypothetical protein Pcac1_g6547 [Phytophthora cactorum]KAG2889244.1 hypothetical protein PC115_g19798 [Phytophthora cactorum]KAG2892465.1 hypothetical protein PC114_g16614 [Phytophthora cactorum]KAG2900070.1 hypothetical protein PC117_g22070 [Phytophthora cactorum]KAG2978097.1 hypothetical protein PC119_g21833 [Phytophthora cactorum]